MQLSKLENRAHEELIRHKIVLFKARDLVVLLKINKVKTYNIIKALKNKGVIRKIGRSYFAFKDVNEFSIASGIHWPSYISFWSALNYYGLSDQMPQKIFLVTTKYTKDIGIFKYVTLSKKRFFGYIQAGDIVIADKEKAIIDSLLFPKYAGGIREIVRCIDSGFNELNMKKLFYYAVKVESKAVLRRLSFILDSINYKGKEIKKLRKNIGKGYELLDPTLPKKNNLNHQWLLDINI